MCGEEGELGSPTLDRLIAVLAAALDTLRAAHVFPSLRAQVQVLAHDVSNGLIITRR